MPWMRVAIGVGCAGLVAGVAGMSFWIDDGSHYFELAAASASAGLLTLVTCVLTRVFGSSHGSQDDAFTRGRSMGYDAGFLEGHRTARPVVVPLHAVDRGVADRGVADRGVADRGVADRGVDDQQVPFNVIVRTDEAGAKPLWVRDVRDGAKARTVAWVGARRMPLLAGAMCLALVGAVFGGALVRRPAPEAVSQVPVGALINRAGLPPGTTPALVGTPVPSLAPHAVVAGAAPGAPVAGGRSAPAGGSQVGAVPAALSSGTGVAVAAPGAVYLPAAARPAAAPAVAPVVAATAVPLTPAQQTAADAAAAAALTAKNAKAAADLTAANAKAAAAATAKAAADAAWAVAHPKP
jgi:hypothetical protein